jgi:hypothetical protein
MNLRLQISIFEDVTTRWKDVDIKTPHLRISEGAVHATPNLLDNGVCGYNSLDMLRRFHTYSIASTFTRDAHLLGDDDCIG